MEKYGSELIFLSQIKRDGSGTMTVKKSYIKLLQKEILNISCLSATEKTFIASGFNSFVVKIKSDKLIQKSKDITLLEKYSIFLEKNGYIDTDWKTEEPFAIDEFIRTDKE